jgi:hypothetical protein
MSAHWKPDTDLDHWTPAESRLSPARASWPQGATVGLALVAAGCLAVGALLYQVARPRHAVDANAAIDGASPLATRALTE